MSKTILVVGAGGGVGIELTDILVRSGYDVIGTVLDDKGAARVRSRVPTLRAAVAVDLSDGDSVQERLLPVLGQPDVELHGVVVCAAICPYGPLETTPLRMLRRTLEINAVADVAIFQTCMPLLRKTKGRFLFISSSSGFMAYPFLGHYVSSKFALEGLGDVMRREAAKWEIKVILIEPGGIKTRMVYDQIDSIKADIDALTPEQRNNYGDLYTMFQGYLEQGVGSAMEPYVVAEAILKALEAADPEPRYRVGQDSIQALHLVRTSSDRQIDAFFKTLV